MRKTASWLPCTLLFTAFIIISWTSVKTSASKKITVADSAAITSNHHNITTFFTKYVRDIYTVARLGASGLDTGVFEKAVIGYFNLKMDNKLSNDNQVITVVDFSRSSRTKRMWIIDLQKRTLLLNTWVAHGNGSGADTPDHFSNEANSFESSLGFYVTNNVYYGKHGMSLRLDGMDAGFNDNAHQRDIVVHGAPYVSQSSIDQLGRLGRSQGCPAVSPNVINKVINTIKGKTLLFISGNDEQYTSKYLNEQLAVSFIFNNNIGAAM